MESFVFSKIFNRFKDLDAFIFLDINSFTPSQKLRCTRNYFRGPALQSTFNKRRKVAVYFKNRQQLRLCHLSLLSPGLRSLRVLPPGY
jgi:hypothetical protein